MSYTAQFCINDKVSVEIVSESRDSLISDLVAFGFQIGVADASKPTKEKQSAKATVAPNGASSTPEPTSTPRADAAAQEPAAEVSASTSAAESVADSKTAVQAVEALHGSANVELTYEGDIKPAVLALVKSKGRDAAVDVLKKFGLSNANEAKPEQYADLLAALKKAGE